MRKLPWLFIITEYSRLSPFVYQNYFFNRHSYYIEDSDVSMQGRADSGFCVSEALEQWRRTGEDDFCCRKNEQRFFRRKRKILKNCPKLDTKQIQHSIILNCHTCIYSSLYLTLYFLLIILSKMDPRPYTYQFRKPRPNNLTYQSYNAYESLYHLGKKEYFNTNSILRDQYSQRINLYSPNYSNPYQREEQAPQKVRESENVGILPLTNAQRYGETAVNTDNKLTRSHSNYSQRSKSSLQQNYNNQANRASVLSTYGSNSLQKKETAPITKSNPPNIVFTRNETSQVFKKQQRPFNIINMSSRQAIPLRNFPKLTRQHLLHEQGMGQD